VRYEFLDESNRTKMILKYVFTGDESWLAYLIESNAMLAFSPVEVAPTVRSSISHKKVLIALFCTANGQLILDDLPKEFKYNQDHSIDNLLPALSQVRTENARHKVFPTLVLHIDNSICQNGAKVTENMS
jgi:hypothetical protein